MAKNPGIRFSHVEIQHVLYEDLDITRRRFLHRQAAEILERRAQPKPEQIATELAHHFSQAGELEKALTDSIHAANHAKVTYVNETALCKRHEGPRCNQKNPNYLCPYQVRLAKAVWGDYQNQVR